MAFLFAAPAALLGQSYTISTFAGGVDGPNGYNGFAGDGGAATSAQLNQPFGVALDSAGNLYIADTVNGRIRRVSGGIITTGAGGGKDPTGTGGRATDAELSRPYAVAFDSSGNLFIADDDSVWEVSNGTITTIMGGPPGASPAAGISVAGPQGLTVDSAGNLYISDSGNNRILRYSNGSVTTIAGSGVKGFSGDGGPAANAELNEPTGLAFDTSGNLYIADSYNNRVRVISGGVIGTFAGTGYANFFGDNIPPTSAAFESLGGLAFDPAGNLYITDLGNEHIEKVANGLIATIAGGGGYGVVGNGDGGPAVLAGLGLFEGGGVAVDASGKVYIATPEDGSIRLLTPNVASTGPLRIITPSLPEGVTTFFYGLFLTAVNGPGPYSWSASGLPPGLSITPTGFLGGFPTIAGTFAVTVTVVSNASTASAGDDGLLECLQSLFHAAGKTTANRLLLFLPACGAAQNVSLLASGNGHLLHFHFGTHTCPVVLQQLCFKLPTGSADEWLTLSWLTGPLYGGLSDKADRWSLPAVLAARRAGQILPAAFTNRLQILLAHDAAIEHPDAARLSILTTGEDAWLCLSGDKDAVASSLRATTMRRMVSMVETSVRLPSNVS